MATMHCENCGWEIAPEGHTLAQPGHVDGARDERCSDTACVAGEYVADEDREDTAYGLTFGAWLKATGRRDSASRYDLRAAWRAGEDPAGYVDDAPPPESGGAIYRR